MRVIAIAGMHRSGTSDLARRLHESGAVYMGKEFIAPASDNPRGFYENKMFKEMNERILKEAGGDWRDPPSEEAVMKAMHKLRQEMVDVYVEAETNAEVAGAEAWGWKDPRNCLTLNAWKQVVRIDQVLIVKRATSDVIRSLVRRNGMGTTKACELAEVYNQRINALEW